MKKLTQSYMTGEGSGQLLYETIGSCFDRVVAQNPDTLALVVRHQDVHWTYREFSKQVDRLATDSRSALVHYPKTPVWT